MEEQLKRFFPDKLSIMTSPQTIYYCDIFLFGFIPIATWAILGGTYYINLFYPCSTDIKVKIIQVNVTFPS